MSKNKDEKLIVLLNEGKSKKLLFENNFQNSGLSKEYLEKIK